MFTAHIQTPRWYLEMNRGKDANIFDRIKNNYEKNNSFEFKNNIFIDFRVSVLIDSIYCRNVSFNSWILAFLLLLVVKLESGITDFFRRCIRELLLHIYSNK